jgi:hypothetical protein
MLAGENIEEVKKQIGKATYLFPKLHSSASLLVADASRMEDKK